MSQRESGSEVKMPVAEEEDLTWDNFDQFPASSRTGRINRIRDIQRRTILACAQSVLLCWTRLSEQDTFERIADKLERLAASLGEPE